MHPGRARCTFWPGRSKDQERPAYKAMPPRSYLQIIASTRVSASPPPHHCAAFGLLRRLRRRRPLRRVHLARHFQRRRCSAPCCLHWEEFQYAVCPPSSASVVSIASSQQETDTLLGTTRGVRSRLGTRVGRSLPPANATPVSALLTTVVRVRPLPAMSGTESSMNATWAPSATRTARDTTHSSEYCSGRQCTHLTLLRE